jgi:hypothetical protein
MGGALSIDSPTPDLKNNLYRLQNVSNNFKFHLEKCIQANGGTFEQELQEGTIFHNLLLPSHFFKFGNRK